MYLRLLAITIIKKAIIPKIALNKKTSYSSDSFHIGNYK